MMMTASAATTTFGGGLRDASSKVHEKPLSRTQLKRRAKKRVALAFLVVVLASSTAYHFLRRQTVEEARRIIGSGRKARTDLEGQVLIEEAIKDGRIGREVINFDDGSLDRMIEENRRKQKMEEEERKVMFHEESHDDAKEEEEEEEEENTNNEDADDTSATDESTSDNVSDSNRDDDDDSDSSSTRQIIEKEEDTEDEPEQVKRGDEQEDVQEEDAITDERLDEVRPGAGDADDLDPKLSRSELLPEDPSHTCSVDRLRTLFRPCLLGGDAQSCCEKLDSAFAPDATHRFENQNEGENDEDTTANCLCVFTAMSDLNETFSKVGLNVYEDVLDKCEPDARKFGWFGDGTDRCPEDNLEELRKRKEEEIREHEEARKERERKKKEIYRRNVERAKKQEAIRVENALKKSDTERQARELRRREREENLRKEARLVTWRLKEAKAAEKALKEAEAKQAKFFGTGGGIQDVGCYEEGEKPMKGQKPC